MVISRMAAEGLGIDAVDLFRFPSLELLADFLQNMGPSQDLIDSIVPVRTTGRTRPLFLMHENHGVDFYFQVLAEHIDTAIPVYGISGIALGRPQLNRMEDLAERVVQCIRRVQRRGPYRLAGWSFGGLLAYAVAQRLQAQGEDIEYLGLLDTLAPQVLRAEDPRTMQADGSTPQRRLLTHCSDRPEAALNGLQNMIRRKLKRMKLQKLWKSVDELSYEELWQRCVEARINPEYLDERNADEARSYIDRLWAHTEAVKAYEPAAIVVPTHLYAAQDRHQSPDSETPISAQLGWDAVLPVAQIEISVIPGDHHSMMSEHGLQLGAAISAHLLAGTKGK
jgi:thioesterase domain-containing protein